MEQLSLVGRNLFGSFIARSIQCMDFMVAFCLAQPIWYFGPIVMVWAIKHIHSQHRTAIAYAHEHVLQVKSTPYLSA